MCVSGGDAEFCDWAPCVYRSRTTNQRVGRHTGIPPWQLDLSPHCMYTHMTILSPISLNIYIYLCMFWLIFSLPHTYAYVYALHRPLRPSPSWWRPRLRPCKRLALSLQRPSYPTMLRPPPSCCRRTHWKRIRWRLEMLFCFCGKLLFLFLLLLESF